MRHLMLIRSLSDSHHLTICFGKETFSSTFHLIGGFVVGMIQKHVESTLSMGWGFVAAFGGLENPVEDRLMFS